MTDAGVLANPNANGIIYGIFNTKDKGVSNNTMLSFGVNLKYNKYITSRSIIATIAHSIDNAYICSTIKSDANNAMQPVGKKEHINETIKTTAALSI